MAPPDTMTWPDKPYLAKNLLPFSMKTTVFKKKHLFHQSSKNQYGHKKMFLFPGKCTLNAEGLRLACQLEPNLASLGVSSKIKLFFGPKKRLILLDTLFVAFPRMHET